MGCGSSKQDAYEEGYRVAMTQGQQPMAQGQQPYAGAQPYPPQNQPKRGRKGKLGTNLGFLGMLAG